MKIKCICPVCGKVFFQYPSRVKQGIECCSRKCQGVRMRGENNPNFKQGFSINQWGYKMININGHKVYEHRYVMEQYLGRKLKHGEEIHHIDGNKLNNSIDNLQLLTTAEHRKLHVDPKTGKHVPYVQEVKAKGNKSQESEGK